MGRVDIFELSLLFVLSFGIYLILLFFDLLVSFICGLDALFVDNLCLVIGYNFLNHKEDIVRFWCG